MTILLANKMRNALRPSEGPYYLVPFPEGWEVMAFPDEHYGGIGHIDAWKQYVVPQIQSRYGIQFNPMEKIQADESPYAFPRGRVGATMPNVQMQGEEPGHWYIYYGSDTPKSVGEDTLLRKVASAFGLNGYAARDMVHLKHAGHETMKQDESKLFSSLIQKKRNEKQKVASIKDFKINENPLPMTEEEEKRSIIIRNAHS